MLLPCPLGEIHHFILYLLISRVIAVWFLLICMIDSPFLHIVFFGERISNPRAGYRQKRNVNRPKTINSTGICQFIILYRNRKYEFSKTTHSSIFSAITRDNSLSDINDCPSISVDVSLPPIKTGATTTST